MSDFDIDEILSEYLSSSEQILSASDGDVEEDAVFIPVKLEREPEPESEARKRLYVAHPRRDDSPTKRLAASFAALVFALISAVILCWTAVNVHPGTTSKVVVKGSGTTNVPGRITMTVNNAKADSLRNLAQIKKIYKIDENATVAPAPNASDFGRVSTDRAGEVMAVIQKARDSGLLEGQEVLFNPDADFFPDDDIRWYCDDSILVICWKEWIEGRVCSCAEVKIADGSQIRRKLVNDTYGADSQDYASNIADSVNAVVAMNADFYAFRDLGITVYQREVFRFNEYDYAGFHQAYNSTDTLFIDTKGDFLFFRKGDTSTRQAMQKWVDDNDVLFAIAFGPVLIDNGEVLYTDSYPVGEINSEYSRAGLGQFDRLHYLYMTVSHSVYGTPRCTVNEFAQIMATKNLQKAYCFDGGQTGELVFQGEPYNYIDFGAERTVTDIIYFATAVPSLEVSG